MCNVVIALLTAPKLDEVGSILLDSTKCNNNYPLGNFDHRSSCYSLCCTNDHTEKRKTRSATEMLSFFSDRNPTNSISNWFDPLSRQDKITTLHLHS